MRGYRIGIDVGGTFTDLVAITPGGDVIVEKAPTTPSDESEGVLAVLSRLAERVGRSLEDVCRETEILVHGTTTADNTMIQMNGAPTGLLVTAGHRDEIEMRRCYKESIWDPTYPPPPPIARRRFRIPIPERMNHKGEVVLPLDEAAVRRGVRRLRELGARSIAVVFLFSFVNPRHERRAAEIVREEFPDAELVTLSHEVLPRGPEFERTSTTLVNAYVGPRIVRYVGRLRERLERAGFGGRLLLMQSTGGVMPPEYVARRAVSVLGSGPTGGVMAAVLAARRAGIRDFVASDMGGTSYDVCLVRNGVPEIKTDWNWRYRYYIALPMVDVQSIGAGGGSIAEVHDGVLQVGPRSAGSRPGPACYGLGGIRATVADADAILGYLPPVGFAAGRMKLDLDAARDAVERDVARPLGWEVERAAWGIERLVHANMANATRRILATHGADPRELCFIAYGGNGGVHAWAIARELGIRRYLVPKTAPAFSALGVLVADYRIDLLKSYVSPLGRADVSRLRSLFREVLEEAEAELVRPAGLPRESVELATFVQMAYPGQSFDLSVPCPEGPELSDVSLLAERFHAEHEKSRGFAFRDQEPLVRGVRLVGTGFTPKPERTASLGTSSPARAKTGSRRAWFEEGFLETPVYDGTRLAPGSELRGPALVEEPFTVVVLPPGAELRLDEHGNYDIRLV